MSNIIIEVGSPDFSPNRAHRYAAIKNGKIVNVIAVDPEPKSYGLASTENFFESQSAKQYDQFVRIDNLESEPHIGWLYDGKIFTPASEQDNEK